MIHFYLSTVKWVRGIGSLTTCAADRPYKPLLVTSGGSLMPYYNASK
jgi:hypothetical protein